MSTYRTILTNTGSAKIAAAVASSGEVEMIEMAVGDGMGNPTTPVATQTSLVREFFRATLNRLVVDPTDSNRVIAEMIVPYDQGGFTVREVGLFDVDGALIAVGNHPQVYKPTVAEGGTNEMVIRMTVTVSNSSVITLLADPSVIIATRSWVLEQEAANLHVPTGGTVGYILKKTGSSDTSYAWADAGAIEFTIDSRSEVQTLAAGQTVVTLATNTTEALAVYISGVRLLPTEWTANTSSQLTLGSSYPDGTKIHCVQNDNVDSAGSVTPVAGTLARRDSSGRTQVATPSAGDDAVPKTYADALGTDAATVSTIMRRDASGRTKVAAPSAGGDVVNKTYADALGDAAATASTIMRRDASGRTKVADPAADDDAATKLYADNAWYWRMGAVRIFDVGGTPTGALAVDGDFASATKSNPSADKSYIDVVFSSAVASDLYMVLIEPSPYYYPTDEALSATVTYAVSRKTTSGFRIVANQWGSSSQSLVLRMIIVPLRVYL